MIRATILAFLVALGTCPALAQTPPSPPPTAPQEAIVNGKHLQPHLEPGRKEQDPEAANRLLQQGANDPAAQAPIVVPHDIYGNPIGGSPGLNPPGLPPQPANAPPKS
jgi:hypothetical protein